MALEGFLAMPGSSETARGFSNIENLSNHGFKLFKIRKCSSAILQNKPSAFTVASDGVFFPTQCVCLVSEDCQNFNVAFDYVHPCFH